MICRLRGDQAAQKPHGTLQFLDSFGSRTLAYKLLVNSPDQPTPFKPHSRQNCRHTARRTLDERITRLALF